MGNSGILEGFHEGGIIISGFVSEQDDGWLLLSENGFNLILGEFEDGWDHEWLDEFNERILISFTRVWHNVFLEFSVENNSWGGTIASFSSMDEGDLVFGVGVGDVSILVESIVFRSVVSNHEFVGGLLLFELVAGD